MREKKKKKRQLENQSECLPSLLRRSRIGQAAIVETKSIFKCSDAQADPLCAPEKLTATRTRGVGRKSQEENKENQELMGFIWAFDVHFKN